MSITEKTYSAKIGDVLKENNFDTSRTFILPYNNGNSVVIIGTKDYTSNDYGSYLIELDINNNFNVVTIIDIGNDRYIDKIYMLDSTIIFAIQTSHNVYDILSYADRKLNILYKGLISMNYFEGFLACENKLSAIGINNGKIERVIIENNNCTVENLDDFIPEISTGVSETRIRFNKNNSIPYHELVLRDGSIIFLEANGMNYVVSSSSSNNEKSLEVLGDRIYGDEIDTKIVIGYSQTDYKDKEIYLFFRNYNNTFFGRYDINTENADVLYDYDKAIALRCNETHEKNPWEY